MFWSRKKLPEMEYKKKKTLEERKNESSEIMTKHQGRLPVFVEKDKHSDVTVIEKNKFLVPSDITVGHLITVIRRRINLTSEQALFIFINNHIPISSDLMSKVYEENKDEDGFLYILYSGENYFG